MVPSDRAADSGDGEPLEAAELVLDPGRAPAAGRVAGVEAFGDDALQAEVGDFGDERVRPLESQARGRAPGRPVELELLEQRSALPVGKASGRAAVEMEDVKGLEQSRRRVGTGAGEASAEPREVWAAVRT